MTDGNGDKKQPPRSVTIYAQETEIEQLGNRLKFVIPGGEDLSPLGAVRAADYGRAIDANLARGEIYAWEDSKGLHIVEGYKLLVRWARRQSDFLDREERLTPREMEERGLDPEKDIGYRVWILREDKIPTLNKLIAQMAPFAAHMDEPPYDKAYREVAQCAVGVVTKKDRLTKKGDDKDPPTGWTWHDVAIKRALKNALNKAYGIPSPREIADESWRVGEVQTTEQDWEIVNEEMPDAPKQERELLAAQLALSRERQAELEAMSPEERQAALDGAPVVVGHDSQEPPEDQGAAPPQALEPGEIRRACRCKARWAKGKRDDWGDAVRQDVEPINAPISDDVLKMVNAAMNSAITGRKQKDRDAKRHEVYQYLFGVSSGNALTNLEGVAILAWLGKPEGEVGEVKDLAAEEVEAVLLVFQEEAGQAGLPGM